MNLSIATLEKCPGNTCVKQLRCRWQRLHIYGELNMAVTGWTSLEFHVRGQYLQIEKEEALTRRLLDYGVLD